MKNLALPSDLAHKLTSFAARRRQRQQQDDEGITNTRVFLLLFMGALVGSGFAVLKNLQDSCTEGRCAASEFALVRFVPLAVLSLPFLFRADTYVILCGLESGAWAMIGFATQGIALQSMSAFKCAFLACLTVVFIPFWGFMTSRRKVHRTDGGALLIMALAVIVMEFVGYSSGFSATLIAMGQPIGFASSYLLVEKYQEELITTPRRVLTLAAIQCFALGVLSIVWFLFDYKFAMPDLSYMAAPGNITAIVWTGFFTTALAIYLLGLLLLYPKSKDTTIIYATSPIWTSLFGIVFPPEHFEIGTLLGGVLILGACALSCMKEIQNLMMENQYYEKEKTIPEKEVDQASDLFVRCVI